MSKARQQGFTLIEVLVAIFVLSIGLLGLAALQMWAVKNTGNAFYRTQATLAANELAERIRANPEGRVAGSYDDNNVGCAAAPAKSCIQVECSPTELALDDLFTVACGVSGPGDGSGIDDTLPQGKVSADCSGDCTVTFTWLELSGEGNEESKKLEIRFTP
ncbi:MAG: type IV pilus modification protein PilV [bacterium]